MEDIDIINRLLTDKIGFTFWWVQLFMGIFIPFVLLLLVSLLKKRENLKLGMISLSSVLIIIGVFAMRKVSCQQ